MQHLLRYRLKCLNKTLPNFIIILRSRVTIFSETWSSILIWFYFFLSYTQLPVGYRKVWIINSYNMLTLKISWNVNLDHYFKMPIKIQRQHLILLIYFAIKWLSNLFLIKKINEACFSLYENLFVVLIWAVLLVIVVSDNLVPSRYVQFSTINNTSF